MSMRDRAATSLLVTALAIALLALSACRPSLDEAQRAWQRDHPDSYVFDYQPNCACSGSGLWRRITVRDDSVVATTMLDSRDSIVLHGSLDAHPTISQLLDGMATFERRPHTWLRVHYDSHWHFPTDARGDATDRVGAGWHFYVRNFHPTPEQ